MIPFLVLTFLFLVPSSSPSSLAEDGAILASLKKGFISPTPAALDGWDTSNPSSVCSWQGVQCDGGRVVAIDISNINVSGTVITAEFSSLDKLVNLSLAGNDLYGTIAISNMSSLCYLNISNNQFNGGVEWDYSTLPSLEVFDAYNNNFTAPLPLGVVKSNRLRYLDIAGNFFFGEIPAAYGMMASLEYLSLAGNSLHGKIPGSLGNLTGLKQLYLGYYNVFDGGIPAELGSLRSLVHLDLSSCGLDGEIPPQLGELRALDTLFLHTNLLSGPIPASLGNLTSMVSLDLSNNALTGEIPSALASLRRLRLLNLFMNKIQGPLPAFLAEFPDMEVLSLFTNNLTGTIPASLGSNGKLQLLDISSNRLTGTIPSNLCPSSQLRILILLKNFLLGPIPESLGRCSSLVRVRLGQNYLNGSIPAGFLYLPGLNLVELQNNYLSGVLSENPDPTHGPTQLPLAQLDLSNNLLSGPLPPSISDLSSLQTLLLRNNRFDGPIPPALCALPRLAKVDLSWNAFSGPIPAEIGNCSQLSYLDAAKNNLSGQIPPEILRARMLSYLNLSRNHLDHAVPGSIGGMKSLTSVDFSFNDLSGELPGSGQFLYFNASAFAGNPGLCGPVVSTPCNMNATGVQPGKVPRAFKWVFVLGLVTCSFAFAVTLAVKARSSKRHQEGDAGRTTKWKLTTFRKVDFSAADVVECIKDSNIVGRGGAGVVYVGRLPSGDEIAVKRLLRFGPNGHDHGFRAEIRTLGNIRHRNIVRLLAVCSDSQTNLLVFEYMRNGSLGEVLHGKGGGFLGWDLRYRIAVEAARGLCYLHHDCNQIIVHRDVKSNNILLGSDFEAHVADFGLAKFLMNDSGASECMSAIAGSYGYIAPEYAYTLRVDEKSDVYSYGVVLLELLTGRKPVGEFGDGVDIVQWAKKSTGSNKEQVVHIIDSRLSAVPVEEAMHVFFVAMLCVQEMSVERPTMREVVQMLSEFPRHLREDGSPPSATAEGRPSSPCKGSANCYRLFPDLLN